MLTLLFRIVFVFSVLAACLSTSYAEVVHEPIPNDLVVLEKIYPKVRFVRGMSIFDTSGSALEQPGELCRPNTELGRTIVEYDECCQEDENGNCTGNRSCRKVVATCANADGSGTYESHGLPDCGECIAIDPEDTAEYEAPFCF